MYIYIVLAIYYCYCLSVSLYYGKLNDNSSRQYSTNLNCTGPGSMYNISRIVEVPYTVCL